MFSSLRTTLLVLLVGLVSTTVFGDDTASRLEKIFHGSRLKTEELGASVFRLEKGLWVEVWNHRATESMIPASLTKLLTAAAILQSLGPSRKLETRLWAMARPVRGQLDGDIYLEGGGDPGFVSETLWFLVNELTRTGVKEIKGNVVIDASRFDEVKSDESRQEERVDRAFDAPVGAMSFNWNSVNIFVRPGEKVGDNAFVTLDPLSPYVELVGQVKTTNSKSADIQIERISVSAQKDRVRVNGQIGKDAKEFVAYKNISQPLQWAGANFIEFLKQRGISVSGTVRDGKLPEKALLLAKAESKSIASMVTDMMKFSNNFVAEMLVKNLAAESGERPASLATGIKRAKEVVTSFGILDSAFTYKSPSGFSRDNKIAPQTLATLLKNIHDQAKIYPEYASALPIGGVDGTLKSRMKSLATSAQIRAKTGLLNGVAGLGGYATNASGIQYTFVFLFNGRASLGDDARQLFDRLATTLVE